VTLLFGKYKIVGKMVVIYIGFYIYIYIHIYIYMYISISLILLRQLFGVFCDVKWYVCILY